MAVRALFGEAHVFVPLFGDGLVAVCYGWYAADSRPTVAIADAAAVAITGVFAFAIHR